jgi:hypothetical protein
MLCLIVPGLRPIGFGLSYGSSGEVLASGKQVSAMPSPSQSWIPLYSFRLPDIDGRRMGRSVGLRCETTTMTRHKRMMGAMCEDSAC